MVHLALFGGGGKPPPQPVEKPLGFFYRLPDFLNFPKKVQKVV